MSTIFDGLLVQAALSCVRSLVSKLHTSHGHLSVSEIGPNAVAIAWVVSRNVDIGAEVDRAGITFSQRFGQCLRVSYDDRIGHRASVLYRDGVPVAAFGSQDELWTVLSEDGSVNPNTPRLRGEQLHPNEEYDCVENAIQLGLKKLGEEACWPALRDWMDEIR